MAKEEKLSRSENIIFWVLFLLLGGGALYITSISEDTLITTFDYLLYSFIVALILCGFIYKSSWGTVFNELSFGITILILVTLFVMMSFTVVNYVFAKHTLVATNYKIEKAYEKNIRRSNKKQTTIIISHKDKEMKIKPSRSLYEVQQYSHVKIQKWQGFFGYGAEIIKDMEFNNK